MLCFQEFSCGQQFLFINGNEPCSIVGRKWVIICWVIVESWKEKENIRKPVLNSRKWHICITESYFELGLRYMGYALRSILSHI